MTTTTLPVPVKPKAAAGPGTGKIVAYVLLVIWAVISLMPFYLSAVYSLMPKANIFDPPRLIPEPFTLANFQAIFGSLELFPVWLLNSIVISMVIVTLRLIFCSAAGYAFARISFPGRDTIFWVLLFTMTLPGIVTLIPKYLLLNEVDKLIVAGPFGDFLAATFDTRGKLFIGTAMAVIVPDIAPAAGVFMARQFFQNFPKEVEESAELDGLSRISIFARIVLPLATPFLLGYGVLQFQGAWNDFMWPNIVLNKEAAFTLPLGLAYLRGLYTTVFSYVLAGSMFNSLPIIVIFLVFQRFFIGGIALSGLKEG
jgi:multiple sugar transport system permease protein